MSGKGDKQSHKSKRLKSNEALPKTPDRPNSTSTTKYISPIQKKRSTNAASKPKKESCRSKTIHENIFTVASPQTTKNLEGRHDIQAMYSFGSDDDASAGTAPFIEEEPAAEENITESVESRVKKASKALMSSFIREAEEATTERAKVASKPKPLPLAGQRFTLQHSQGCRILFAVGN